MRILIANCTPRASERDHLAARGRSNADHFTDSLRLHDDRVATTTIYAADGETGPPGASLDDFDGAILTGSPWGVYETHPQIAAQIDLARTLFDRGVPTFGSCYGLQLMAKALGGDVHVNPRGREIGIARAITVADNGHPLYASKPKTFDALCSHQDEVARLPAGAIVLASNAVSHVQAMAVERGASSFWGVQYHPEFDFSTMAAIFERSAARNIADGVVADAAALGALVADLRALAAGANAGAIATRHRIERDVLDMRTRTAEFGCWLGTRVAPRASARLAARATAAAAGA